MRRRPRSLRSRRRLLQAGALLALGVTLFAGGRAEAGEWDFGGYVATDLRGFTSDAAFAGQDDRRFWPSVSIRPEITYTWNDGDDRIRFVPFGRYDPFDSGRSHGDVREANWLHVGDGWDIVVGINEVFWGVTESRHLVNIINQTDQVEDIDEEDKLGQPMLNLNLYDGWGRLGLYVMPYFRERTFNANDARLRGPFPIIEGFTTYESDLGRAHPDVALRYTQTWGMVDFGWHYFHGTSREPRLIPVMLPGGPVLAPFYEIIDQTGVDVLAAVDNWLFKLEAIGRFGQGSPFLAVSGGVEYTFFDVWQSDIDLGLLAELHYDGRDAGAPVTVFDEDLFGGVRLTFNDIQDTQVLFGGLVDAETGATFLSFESSRRFFESWRAELEARVFINAPMDDPFFAVAQDDFLQLRIARYF